MNETGIEWANQTWNPAHGCTKISPGCKNCYAERMAKRLAGRHGYPAVPYHFAVAMENQKLDEPLRTRKPQYIFVCSMGDLFHREIPDSFIKRVFRTMELATQHTFLVLTKRIKRAHQWFCQRSTGPIPNIWLGVSVENKETADSRLPWLVRAPAAKLFVSCEPLLEEISLRQWLHGLDWVIVGPETGFARRKFDLDWARALRDECKVWDTPFFFKGLARNDLEVPDDLKIEERPDENDIQDT